MKNYIDIYRMSDSQYIEYLEDVVRTLQEELAAEKEKFDNYISNQRKETMNNLGEILNAALKVSEKVKNT